MPVSRDIDIPTPPQTALRLIGLCANPETCVNDIVEAVQLDASLSAKLMRAANSAYYGQQKEVATLHRAAVVLGINYVKVVALGFRLAEYSRDWSDLPIDLKMTWQGNLLRACLARQIALHTEMDAARQPEEAFLIGLLQDFAVPIMAREVGEEYATLVGGNGLFTTASVLPIEQDRTGEHHGELIGRLSEDWRFPPQLNFALRHHHDRPQVTTATDPVMALWQIGYFAGSVPFNEDQQTAQVAANLRHLAVAAFGLGSVGLGQAFYRAIENYDALRGVFDGVLPHDVDGSKIMEMAHRLVSTL